MEHRTRAVEERLAAESEKRGQGVGAISAYLRRAIETGAYSEGDRLPPERQLALTFDAARSTVRRALAGSQGHRGNRAKQNSFNQQFPHNALLPCRKEPPTLGSEPPANPDALELNLIAW